MYMAFLAGSEASSLHCAQRSVDVHSHGVPNSGSCPPAACAPSGPIRPAAAGHCGTDRNASPALLISRPLSALF